MSSLNSGHEFSPTSDKNETLAFADKLRDLLPGLEFEEPTELLEARTAVLEALAMNERGADFLRSIWMEYAKICEQIVDSRTDADPQMRAKLQIVILVHKALIFREAENVQRYGEDLSDAEEYALNMNFREIAEAIGAALDDLAD